MSIKTTHANILSQYTDIMQTLLLYDLIVAAKIVELVAQARDLGKHPYEIG